MAGYTLRKISHDDDEAYLTLCRQLDEETTFMLQEPGERRLDAHQTRRTICDVLAAPNHIIFVAVDGSEFVGFAAAKGGAFRRNRHVAVLIVGVLKACWSRGIATNLIAAVEDWAHSHGITRLELTVMEDNSRARRLYEHLGFSQEGMKLKALKVSGKYINEIQMAKLLPSTERDAI